MDIYVCYFSNMFDFYYDNCLQVFYMEWWVDLYWYMYVIEDFCVVFDVYWWFFIDFVFKNWFGVLCQNGYYFICIKLMDGMM